MHASSDDERRFHGCKATTTQAEQARAAGVPMRQTTADEAAVNSG